MEKRPVIFYDLECTGADKDVNKIRIIEISAIKVNIDTLEEIDRLYYRCNNDDVPIAPDASERHGIYEKDLVGYPTFREVADEVYKFFEGCDLGGYYCTFYDNAILYMSFLRNKIIWDYRHLKVYDIYTLYKKYNSGRLGDVYKRYTGGDLEHAHEAEADILATLAVYRAQRKMGEEFEEDELYAYKDTLDIAGNFKIREKENGGKEIYLNFGKHKGVSVDKVDISYLEWISNNSDGFPLDTRHYARKIVEQLKGK